AVATPSSASRRAIDTSCSSLEGGTVLLLNAHIFVHGARPGPKLDGGDRGRLLVFDRRMFEVDPVAMASSSIDEGRLQRATDLVGDWVDTGVVPGASLLIARGDNLVVEGYRGLADIK